MNISGCYYLSLLLRTTALPKQCLKFSTSHTKIQEDTKKYE